MENSNWLKDFKSRCGQCDKLKENTEAVYCDKCSETIVFQGFVLIN
jgi:hypothetical protein